MDAFCANADCAEHDVAKDVPEPFQADYLAGQLEILCGACGEPIPPDTAS